MMFIVFITAKREIKSYSLFLVTELCVAMQNFDRISHLSEENGCVDILARGGSWVISTSHLTSAKFCSFSFQTDVSFELISVSVVIFRSFLYERRILIC